MMLGSCRRRVIEVCRTKKKCGFRGFHTSCSGSQMNPSMEQLSKEHGTSTKVHFVLVQDGDRQEESE